MAALHSTHAGADGRAPVYKRPGAGGQGIVDAEDDEEDARASGGLGIRPRSATARAWTGPSAQVISQELSKTASRAGVAKGRACVAGRHKTPPFFCLVTFFACRLAA